MPPSTCNLTGSWEFLARTGQTETNNFTEASSGIVQLTPGRNDEWTHATGVFAKDWSLEMVYDTESAPSIVMCKVNTTCNSISCQGKYTYTKKK
jgi:hypothetical protein